MPVPTPNLRDLGGLRALDGSVVAPGRLLRSALPAADDLGPEGQQWPPSVVVDLRSRFEQDEQHPLVGLGSRLVSLPLLHSLRPGWTHEATLSDLYALLLDESAHLLVELVREVASAEGSTLVHCAAGKDRTGVAVALVLSLLGVEADDVRADYLRTRDALEAIDARLRRDDAPHPINPVFFSVDPDALEVVLQRWSAHPDGASGWFESVGGSRDDVTRLREGMLA